MQYLVSISLTKFFNNISATMIVISKEDTIHQKFGVNEAKTLPINFHTCYLPCGLNFSIRVT